MSAQNYIVTGTDTDIGKTVFSAMLMLALGEVADKVSYWKPIQSGIEGAVDTRVVQRLTNLPDENFVKEAYVLTEPLSPHRAAEIDGVKIDMDALKLPKTGGSLIIEGAGGLMVPITRKQLFINQFKRWRAPVILCARTGLGTINHTLLSLEALWSRKIPILGIAFIGEENIDNMNVIAELSGEKVLGHLPMIEDLDADKLLNIFHQNFNIRDFLRD